MVLSRLWHYTQHVAIPATVVKRWQSMLNRFVLSRKHDRDASHIQLIPQEFLFQRRSDGGLGIPSLDAHLKRQRLQLLLQFMSAASAMGERGRTSSSSSQLAVVQFRNGGHQALDFLSISPLRHGDMIKRKLTSSWWKATWIWWYKIRWEVTWRDLPPEERTWYGLRQPIWFHSDAELHFEQTPRTHTSTAHRQCIGMVVEPQRSFRLHVSRVFGLRSLADFMREGCAWPMQQDFVQRHLDFSLASVTPGRQLQWLRVLYKEATQIVERLGVRQLVLHAPSSARRLLPYLGCKSGAKVCLTPAIPRSALLRAVWTPKPPTMPHLMTVHSQCVDDEQIKAYVKYNRHLRTILVTGYTRWVTPK